MRNVTRIVFLLFVGLLLAGKLQAHDVVWYGNVNGFVPSIPLKLYFPNNLFGSVNIAPSSGEPCTVMVNLNPPSSTLVTSEVISFNPANTVTVLVMVLRAPSNHLETATISGEWHATGIPAGAGCTALTPNPFSVPITVSDQEPRWQIIPVAAVQRLNLNTGYDCFLQFSRCITGPWLTVGQGQMFTVASDRSEGYFQRNEMLGGIISGTVKDFMGNPLPNVQFSLFYGGAMATADNLGWYTLPRTGYGVNEFSIFNPLGVGVNVEISNTDNIVIDWQAGMAVGATVSNACNCTPWCAITFGSLPGGRTPVFYAGGADPPTNGIACCDPAQVMVTPPSGKTFSITPGSNGHHNSGPNPASGTWTITTTVCGQSKSASVTVP